VLALALTSGAMNQRLLGPHKTRRYINTIIRMKIAGISMPAAARPVAHSTMMAKTTYGARRSASQEALWLLSVVFLGPALRQIVAPIATITVATMPAMIHQGKSVGKLIQS